MAFNVQAFKTRALTAVVFVLVMLAGLLWNHWSFLALFTIIHTGCWIEYRKLVYLIDPEYQKTPKLHQYSIEYIGLGFMFLMTGETYQIGNTSLQAIGERLMLAFTGVFLISVIVFFRKARPKLATHSVMGFLYISLGCGLMMPLYGNMQQEVFAGPNWLMPVILIASIWINDTMAYVVGSFIGKTPFSPISPKKTWEGTIGGAILAVVVITVAGYYGFGFPVKALLLISSIAAIAGTAGDLFESKLKRLAGVKDSGNIMPGHGGFLDRFDSLLLATTATWVIFSLFY